MKKILLASTMLVSVAGFAAADVSVSGSARMGIVNDGADSQFSSRIRINFAGSGTTDGGLAFGASIRADNSVDGAAGDAGSVFISGAFGKIAMGDVDSGDAATVGQLDGGVGYTGLGSLNSVSYAADGGFSLDDTFGGDTLKGGDPEHAVYIGNATSAKVLYTYSAGGLTVAASSAQIAASEDYDLTSYGVGASYTTGGLTAAVGYGSSDLTVGVDLPGSSYDYIGGEGSVTDLTASVGYVMGDTTVKAIYQDKQLDVTSIEDGDISGSAVSMGASVKHKLDAVSLTAYARSTKYEGNMYEGESLTTTNYGIGASYDLGGGASVAAGWVSNEHVGLVDNHIVVLGQDEYDVGVNFSF